jgi:hypothetical protein
MAISPASSPLLSNNDTFHLFPKLPTELRLRIWQFAAYESRYLALHCLKPEDPPPGAECFIFQSAASMLHACQDSRAEARLAYIKAFSVLYNPRFITINYDTPTPYINNMKPNIYTDDDWLEMNHTPLVRLVATIKSQVLLVYEDLPYIGCSFPMRFPSKEFGFLTTFNRLVDLCSDEINWFAIDYWKYAFEWKGSECPKMRITAKETDDDVCLESLHVTFNGEVVGTFVVICGEERRSYLLVKGDGYRWGDGLVG